MARVSGLSRISELGRRRGAQASARPRRGARNSTSSLDSPRGARSVNWKTTGTGVVPRARRAAYSGGVVGPAFESLKEFLERSVAARKATRPLSRDARVNLLLAEGPARFTMEGGAPALLPGEGRIRTSPSPCPPGQFAGSPRSRARGGNVRGGVLPAGAGAGPALRVADSGLDAATGRLLAHGYLGVLAMGGIGVTLVAVRNGVKNPPRPSTGSAQA